MVVLCDECFPDWEQEEVYTVVPVSPCVNCGTMDSRRTGGPSCHMFRIDPRKKENEYDR